MEFLDTMNEFIKYLIENSSTIFFRTGEHIKLAFFAVGLSCLLGVPVGILISRHEKIAKYVIGVANVIQTIPSLALFAFVIPIFGIGSRNAIFALFLYGLLPIIKNTYIGINNVDPAINEAAIGMGMSKTQVLYKVKIPLAISVIMGGVRIATVTCIGVATIATLIGAGGLGLIIYNGISMVDFNKILSGAIPAALLALIVDYLLGVLERKLTSKGLDNPQ